MKSTTGAVVAAVAMACAPAAQVSIPTLGHLEAVRDGGTAVLLARVTVGNAVLGFALSCAGEDPMVTVSLGPFPPRLSALQLVTRTTAGAVTRFGEAFRADAASGFHSPQLVGADLDEFLRPVLEPETVVSNGYSSYQVQLTSAERTRLMTFLEDCGR